MRYRVSCKALLSMIISRSNSRKKIGIITDAEISLEENLVYKAAILMKERLSVKKGAVITLKKEIPMSAGLGGGSSDAACTLAGLNRLWGLELSKDELAGLGGMLGSDIPFFFKGPFCCS